jgi:glycosyltransferase involved in cell wall biosynthesis
MKVTHVYRYSYPPLHGGIEQHIHTLVHQLKHRVKAEVLVSGTRANLMLDDGVPIRSTGTWGHVMGSPVSPSFPYWLRRSGASLLHFHMPNPTGECSYLLAGAGVPSVVTYHMETVRYARALRYYRPFIDMFLRRTSRIIVSTPQHIETSSILPAHRDKCRVMPFGIDVHRFKADAAVLERARTLRQQYGEFLVLYVGKLRHYKGLEYLLRAMQQVPGRALIVGTGEEKERLQALASELRIEDRIVWLPHLEDKDFVATFHACDVFVLPSIYRAETFGIVQVEAHACGKPTICTALGTGVEYVNQHGHTGLVVPPSDADALAEALNRLRIDEEYRLQLGENARRRALTEFTQERMAEETIALYHEVLNEKNGTVSTPARGA